MTTAGMRLSMAANDDDTKKRWRSYLSMKRDDCRL
jgi:hypothetical protein